MKNSNIQLSIEVDSDEYRAKVKALAAAYGASEVTIRKLYSSEESVKVNLTPADNHQSQQLHVMINPLIDPKYLNEFGDLELSPLDVLDSLSASIFTLYVNRGDKLTERKIALVHPCQTDVIDLCIDKGDTLIAVDPFYAEEELSHAQELGYFLTIKLAPNRIWVADLQRLDPQEPGEVPKFSSDELAQTSVSNLHELCFSGKYPLYKNEEGFVFYETDTEIKPLNLKLKDLFVIFRLYWSLVASAALEKFVQPE